MNNLLEPALDRQAVISAIETFSERHDRHEIPAHQKTYQDLIPAKGPGSGQQYAFEVDMDRCTGCKACVTACHNENGLDPDETWRTVGLIQGGDSKNPAIQHVTSACHHCVEPACLQGCPTLAYTKDLTTGVVKHLEDQCIGCQYCILKCPYDVPKYNAKKGIVHKCDMCIGRLSQGQAPACARACPNGAIKITLVNTADVKRNPSEYVRVPDAPASDYTFPTTRYKTTRAFPANMESTDYYDVKPEQAHTPLVIMLVLTQLSFGTFLADFVSKKLLLYPVNDAFNIFHMFFAPGIGLLALAASLFHLGRPHLAYRAFLGLRTSWLSREIVSFGLFAKAAILYVICQWWEPLRTSIVSVIFYDPVPLLEYFVLFTGGVGVFCSVMVYRDTKRPFWDHPATLFKFFLTSLILGFVSLLLTTQLVALISVSESGSSVIEPFTHSLATVLIIGMTLKILTEVSVFFHLAEGGLTFLKKTAILMTGVLKRFTRMRFVCALLGGIVIPFVFISLPPEDRPVLSVAAVTLIFILTLAGEFLERYLFFRAVVPLKMPAGSRL